MKYLRSKWLLALLMSAMCCGCEQSAHTSSREMHAGLIVPGGASGKDLLAMPQWPDAWVTPEFSTSLPDNPKSPPRPPTPDIPDRWQVQAQLTWDAEYLYVRFESFGPPPMLAQSSGEEAFLHSADVCEVFVDVTGEKKQIAEIQVDARGRTQSYYHVWSQAPRYTAYEVDEPFYFAHHSRDESWSMSDVLARSVITPAQDGQSRWVVTLAIPMKKILVKSGLSEKLRPGQSVNINLLRYAYEEQNGQMVFRQYNLAPTRHGCPHQSPMAAQRMTLSK